MTSLGLCWARGFSGPLLGVAVLTMGSTGRSWHWVAGVRVSHYWAAGAAFLPAWPRDLLCIFPRELWPSLSHAPGPSPVHAEKAEQALWPLSEGLRCFTSRSAVWLPRGSLCFFFFPLMAVFRCPLSGERPWTQLQSLGQGRLIWVKPSLRFLRLSDIEHVVFPGLPFPSRS